MTEGTYTHTYTCTQHVHKVEAHKFYLEAAINNYIIQPERVWPNALE